MSSLSIAKRLIVVVGRYCLRVAHAFFFCVVGRGMFDIVAEFFQRCLVGRRVGVGRGEGLLLVCLVNVERVFAYSRFCCRCFFIVSSFVMCNIYRVLLSLVFFLLASLLCDRCSCRSVPLFLYLCSALNREDIVHEYVIHALVHAMHKSFY